MAFQTSKINPNKKYTFYTVTQDTHAYFCVYNERKFYAIIFTLATCSVFYLPFCFMKEKKCWL